MFLQQGGTHALALGVCNMPWGSLLYPKKMWDIEIVSVAPRCWGTVALAMSVAFGIQMGSASCIKLHKASQLWFFDVFFCRDNSDSLVGEPHLSHFYVEWSLRRWPIPSCSSVELPGRVRGLWCLQRNGISWKHLPSSADHKNDHVTKFSSISVCMSFLPWSLHTRRGRLQHVPASTSECSSSRDLQNSGPPTFGQEWGTLPGQVMCWERFTTLRVFSWRAAFCIHRFEETWPYDTDSRDADLLLVNIVACGVLLSQEG